MIPLSIVILTQNEAGNIADCIASCRCSDDIHIVDSGSTDATCEIARSLGAAVHTHAFQSFNQQRNWALDNIQGKYVWQYHLDADERLTSDLVSEISRAIGAGGLNSAAAAYRVASKMMFAGKWLQHSTNSQDYQIRLIQKTRFRFAEDENEPQEKTAPPPTLVQRSLHYGFSKGIADWCYKQNRYSDEKAKSIFDAVEKRQPLLSTLWNGNASQRRRALRDFGYRLHGRALWMFFFSYILKMGWLDATPGLDYCTLTSMREYWTELKFREISSGWTQATDVLALKLLAEPSAGGSPLPKVDILIPTRNEASHITQAVTNARMLGPVFVLDSLSTDGTQQLARDAGATVAEHVFVNYADQKNWGLDNLPFTGDWIFILDTDERITPALVAEISRQLSRPDAARGYWINRKLLFMGRDVSHGGLFPSWNLRLFRRGSARYEVRQVHEHMICTGKTDYLTSPMLHVRHESMSRYVEKHIKYADLESDEWVKWTFERSEAASSGQIFKHGLRVRQWIRRRIWPRLALRPVWRFVYMYIVRLGILDGRPGWHLARLMGYYEYTIGLLFREKLALIQEHKKRNESKPNP